jgi:pyruvate dehydrogenase E2 component (dihydrolipoamide acetyltransferase)
MSVNILMPALSPTMEEGTLSKWLVKEGDTVTSGDLIAEIETDKATMEVEAIDDGTIGKILVREGQEAVKVNEPIAILLLDGENLSDIKRLKKVPAIESVQETEYIESKEKLNFSSNKTRDIDLILINGSGPNGRILKTDIENFNNNKNLLKNKITTNNSNSELIKNSSMRKTIAERLVQSKNEAPHFYLSLDCNIDQLLKIRSMINLKSNDKYKISVNDMIIKAASSSLIKVPKANASWENENTRYFNNTDISVAVAIDGGLITPIIKDVQSKGLLEISEDMKLLANKAKDGKLLPEEYVGGSFSISNLGMYGIKEFSAVINPPQGAILAVGSGEKRPIVLNDQLTIASIMTVTLSCDHRVVDGAVGAQFLSVFKDFIENPSLMLL